MKRLLFSILLVVLLYIIIMYSISNISDYNSVGPSIAYQCVMYEEGLNIYQHRGTKELSEESKAKYSEWRNCAISAYKEKNGVMYYYAVVTGDYFKQLFLDAF